MSADLLLKDWSAELVRLIDEAKSDAEADDDFAKGRKFGLGEALSLLQQEARAFGIDAAALGLPPGDGMTIALKG